MRNLTSFLISSLILCGVVVLAGCGDGDYIQPFIHPDVLERAGLKYYWSLDLPLHPQEVIEQVWLMDENLYCLSNLNYLWAVDAASGQTKWYFRVAGKAQTVFKPAHADGVVLGALTPGIAEVLNPALDQAEPFDAVLVNTLSQVFVLDRKDGRQVRKIDLNFAANTGGASDGKNFYVGSTDGRCHAIALREEVSIWKVATSSLLTAPIVEVGGLVFIAGHDSSVTAARAGAESNIIWRRHTGGPISAAFAVDERGCFVGDEDNKIYAFGSSTGQNLWKPFICEGQIRTPVQISQNSVFAYAQDDQFYALNLANGRLRWAMPDGRKVVAVMDGKVYLVGLSQRLFVVDEMLGTVAFGLNLSGMEFLAANTSAPAIYGVNSAGQVRCIRTSEAEYITEELLKQTHP